MLSHRSAVVFFSSAACLLGMSFPSRVSAQPSSCESDAQCARGYRCDVVAYVDCATSCPEDEACARAIEGCGEIRACIPGATCTSDADCGGGMVCLERTHASCSGSGSGARPCPAGEPCPERPPVPPECEEVTARACVPKYAAPCRMDTDCGEGFRCVEQQSCGCSGSGGRDAPTPSDPGTSASSAEDVAPPEECSCAPSGVYRCESLVDVCVVDSDCPADWTCEDHGVDTACTDRPPSGGEPDGRVYCEDQDPRADSVCTAPAFSGYVGGGDVLGGERGDAEDGDESPSAGLRGSSDDSGGCRLSPGGVRFDKRSVIAGLVALVLVAGRRGKRRHG